MAGRAGRGCSRRSNARAKHGARFAFDTNFRARGWPDLDVARAVFQEAFAAADIVLASTEDLLPLYPGESNEALLARISGAEVVLKLSEPASIVRLEGVPYTIKAEAGDAARRRYHGGRRQFCGRLRGRAPCRARIRLRPPAPGIVWLALWYAIPARSSRARRCRPDSSPNRAISRKASP